MVGGGGGGGDQFFRLGQLRFAGDQERRTNAARRGGHKIRKRRKVL